MFLVALTNREVPDAFGDMTVYSLAVGSMTLTIVVDDKVSSRITAPDRVTVVDSLTPKDASRRDSGLRPVVYERRTSTLDISRPMASGRSTYTHMTANGEFFCSTHVSLLRKAGVSIRENTAVLPELFGHRHVMPPRTMYHNIQQLRIGSSLQLQIENCRCVIRRTQTYEPPMPRTDVVPTASDAFERTHELLEAATAQLGGNAENLALLLSGGLDSSILYKICKSEYDLRTTFSTGYPFEAEGQNREKKYAVSAAQAFDTRHTHFQSRVEDFLHGLIESIAAAEEPLQHIQSVLLYVLFKDGIPEDRRLVISGEGAGAISGSFAQALFLERDTTLLRALSKRPIFDILRTLSRLTGRARYWIGQLDNIRRSRLPLADPTHIVWDLGHYGDPQWVARYFKVKEEEISQYQREELRTLAGRSIYDINAAVEFLANVSATQSQWSKLAESLGKLMLCPFLASDVVNYAFTLPWHLKLTEPKYILRGVARRVGIPEEIITRPKSAFGIRRIDWATCGGPFEPLVSLAAKVVEEAEIRNVQSENMKQAMTFWNLLNYAIWKRVCIDQEPVQILHDELEEQLLNTRLRSKCVSDQSGG